MLLAEDTAPALVNMRHSINTRTRKEFYAKKKAEEPAQFHYSEGGIHFHTDAQRL